MPATRTVPSIGSWGAYLGRVALMVLMSASSAFIGVVRHSASPMFLPEASYAVAVRLPYSPTGTAKETVTVDSRFSGSVTTRPFDPFCAAMPVPNASGRVAETSPERLLSAFSSIVAASVLTLPICTVK